MRGAWARGFRELYFSGGDPMLWRDGDYTLADAIAEAKRIGYFHVHIYTNGLLGIEPQRTSSGSAWMDCPGSLNGDAEIILGRSNRSSARARTSKSHLST